jgi:hypothetical protein
MFAKTQSDMHTLGGGDFSNSNLASKQAKNGQLFFTCDWLKEAMH